MFFIFLFTIYAHAELFTFDLTSKVENKLLRWWDKDSAIQYYKNLDGTKKTLFYDRKSSAEK